ncbi:MAG: asparaginase domain-containing protein [Armatimonadota bacterium]|nr:asparaginase domain-containing protein [Armatimonadota bacterium]MDR7548644.1 asparaginase domain-containing protein [Armatimonadota bacterium]
MTGKPRIAHFSGPNATIQNSPPLVTSNKAREKYGLPLLLNPDGTRPRFDVLRPQRLAAPVTVYVEQFSAHPLERDAAELYAPPDGYLDRQGGFHRERQSPDDVPVYEVVLRPEDGLYPLPYMARQADGRPWEEECAYPGAPPHLARQPYYPDGSRTFEEIDRLGVSEKGLGNLLSSRVEVDFFRVLPPAGYTKGLPAALRTDVGEGDIPPERLGQDFFPYRPYHFGASPPRRLLARVTNTVQQVLATGRYLGAIWTQGSPRIEEMVYWFNLLLDITVPLAGCAAQRTHGQLGNDGDRNIVDSVEYIVSRIWADEAGRNRAGVVLIQEQRIFAARDVQKADARPGGYVATGGHGGIIGGVGHAARPTLTYLPARRHTYRSEVNLTRLPRQVPGVVGTMPAAQPVMVPVKGADGALLETAIPRVTVIKDVGFLDEDYGGDPARETELLAEIQRNLLTAPLAGFVVEGLAPYGLLSSNAREAVLHLAVRRGMPVVCVGRGNNEGFTPPRGLFIGGGNLTATKARILLMACLLRFGALPLPADPDRPTDAELEAIRRKVAEYQAVFDTH